MIVVDAKDFRVVPNPGNRFVINNQTPLQYNKDGSLTLAFAPVLPKGVAESNWLPTPAGKPFTLTYRFYGPAPDVVAGKWGPAPLVRQDAAPP